MFLAKVIGHVVATKKDDKMKGRKLLLLRPQLVDPDNPSQLRDGSNTLVAVDNLGAGKGEMVLFVQGSSARATEGMKTLPVDCAVVGLVDTVDALGQVIYQAK